MAKLKTPAKIMIAAAVAGGAFYGLQSLYSHGYLSKPDGGKAAVPQQAALPEIKDATSAHPVAEVALPGSDGAKTGSPQAKILIYAWNAHQGLLFANGGPRTTAGSLMNQAGVDLLVQREDDNDKLTAALMAAAKASKAGLGFGDGSPCVTIMGDGSPAFLAGANAELSKVSPDSIGVIVGSFGFSRGEDKFMGRASWKTNPKSARGALIAGVLRDGDWNIAQKWAGDNNIKNNPDESTYDPDALNWLGTSSYVEAAEKYVSGTATEKDPITGQDLPTGVCVERRVVRDGAPTGEKKTVCVNGVVTWTPGDVTVAHKKGGLVSIVSTKEYRSQMPCTLICVKSWAQKNRTSVESLLQAAFQGADQVRAYPKAAHKAAEISAAVYKEETPEYWEKYARGVTETDKTGVPVPLGGSSVNNYNDNANLFGLSPGSANIFGAVYKTFGDILVQQYPKLYPTYRNLDEILDLSYLKNIGAKSPVSAPADLPTFTGAPIKEIVSKRSWSVEFETGSASFKPDTLKTLEQISNGALVADELAIEVRGHTDNTGDPGGNMELSRRRATAVRDWLMKKSPSNFPATRFTVTPFGQTQPLASNSSEEGRKRNRRVEIVLGVQ